MRAAPARSTVLTARSRELAILVVAEALRSEFEWYAHIRLARAAGIPATVTDCIRDGSLEVTADSTGDEYVTDEDRVVVRVVRAMLARTLVDGETYDRAVALLGERALVELAILVGYYWTLASAMSTFQVGLPDGEQPVWG